MTVQPLPHKKRHKSASVKCEENPGIMQSGSETVRKRLGLRSQNKFADFTNADLPDFSHVPSQVSSSERAIFIGLSPRAIQGRAPSLKWAHG